jgi:hypothetical protein
VKGTTLFLPVQVPGALFSCGDAHGAQGDGEVCVTGCEAPMYGTLRFTLQKGRTIASPQFQAAPGSLTRKVDHGGWYGTTGVGGDLYVAAQDAVRAMVAHISQTYDMSGEDAYLLSSLCVDLRRPLQIAVLLAAEETETIESREVFLRLRKVVEGEIGLADVLVGAEVLGIERERLFVDRYRFRRVAILPGRIGQPVVRVGVRGLTRHDLLEHRDRAPVLLGVDGLHRRRHRRIPGLASPTVVTAATASATVRKRKPA